MMGKENGYSLAGVPIFSAFPEEALTGLSARMKWTHYRSNQIVLSHEDKSTSVLIITSGRLRVQMYAINGRLINLNDPGAGELVGEMAALDGEPRGASIIALEDSLVAEMSAHLFQETMDRHPEFVKALLMDMVGRVRDTTTRLFENTMLDVRGRVLCELWRQALRGKQEKNGILIDPAPTHEFISQQIGTNREAVTRTLNWLEEADIVEHGRQRILIRKPEQLSRLVEQAQGYAAPQVEKSEQSLQS